jgi:regulator of sigma D
LGEVLESRFEMEDFLIENLHDAHAEKVASA